MSDSKKEIMESLIAAFPAWTIEPYVHWAVHASLYSAKTRSYMIKKGIHFTEASPAAGVAGAKDRWAEVIMPALGYSTMPVLDLPDGTFISDTTAIIRYLEEQHPEPPMLPSDPIMRALAWLIFNYGTEGLFLNAQHYRWSFSESADFAAADIGRAIAGPTNIEVIKMMGESFQAMKLEKFPTELGITAETIQAIEKSNQLLFEKLDAHFRHYPYILGGRPSIADAAMMETLHAHLGRDIYPANIMKKTAPALYRWTETMNRPGIVDAELSQVPQEYLDPDNLPDTFLDFLKLVSDDFGPQLEASVNAYENWLATDPERPEGAIITVDGAAMNRQKMGQMAYSQQGIRIKRDAWPDIPNMHQYVLEVVDMMDTKEKSDWSELMQSVGGEIFVNTRLSRPINIHKHQPPYAYVLGENVLGEKSV